MTETPLKHSAVFALGFLIVVLSVAIALGAWPASAADLTVTNTSDVVNGDVSGPGALIARPGMDGISLREAIEVANRGSGPLTITFAPTMTAQTIAPTSSFIVRADGLTIIGLADADGQPSVTLDAGGIRVSPGIDGVLFTIVASDFALTRVRITGVASRRTGIRIQAGQSPFLMAPQAVGNIRIEENVFDNSGTDVVDFGFAVQVWTGARDLAADATISNLRIARNTFLHYTPDGNGIYVGSRGTNNVIKDVVVEGNRFEDVRFQVEIAQNPGSRNQVIGTRIIRNTFTNGGVGVWLGTIGNDPVVPASASTVDDTLIEGNVFSGNDHVIGITAGLGKATVNVVRNTRIINNLVISGTHGIFLTGGAETGSTDNRVEGVQIANNTLSRPHESAVGSAIVVQANSAGATQNVVVGVSVINTIFQGPRPDFAGLSPGDVRSSITSTPGFAGFNGNIDADPRFVNPAAGDFHLQGLSPAVNRGTSDGAPATDFDCRPRIDEPDIGAFEFGAVPGTCIGFSTLFKPRQQ